jgi:putative mRNA 3-end processing factor
VANLDLIELTEEGLYCPAGDFYIDPWRPVARAVITHAHADHATSGHDAVLCSREGAGVTRLRVGAATPIETLAWGDTRQIGDVRVSLHPAGHILGSAQVRVERAGEVWVASGDYKVESDPSCTPFEPVRAHTFITESTFGLPVYRWPAQQTVIDEVRGWWQDNQRAGVASVLFVYALGKAQRILAGLGSACGPIVIHGALAALTEAYRTAGVALPATPQVAQLPSDYPWHDALILAPPSAQGSPWLRRFGQYADGFASGWMLVRGQRRRRAVDRGFVLSDHADWPGLLSAIAATGAGRVLVTHGQVPALVRWLQEQGTDAAALATRFDGEQDDRPDESDTTA